MSIVDQLRALMERRGALTAEIATIDVELTHARQVLGLPAETALAATEPPPSVEPAVARPLPAVRAAAMPPPARNERQIERVYAALTQDSTSLELAAETGLTAQICSAHLSMLARHGRVIVIGKRASTAGGHALNVYRRALIQATVEDITLDGVVALAKELAIAHGHDLAPSETTDRGWLTECTRCGATAVVEPSGDHATYDGAATRQKCTDIKPIASSVEKQPERRCSRCCHKFRPSAPMIYICPDCSAKASRHGRKPDEPAELDTVWRPGKDAPSLSGDAPGLGATLSGGTFKSHAGRL